ncbi:MAG: response regulator [Deltaproteobacteria bacterium]|nr:response regulator [Deltaproteobacteria bacterium]MBW2414522.1 response regulator [Deltaproteobacteria bacterium]
MAQRVKLRILVIDDDEDICLYLKEFLTREGFRVTTVTKPLDALPEIKEGRHQVVLLDVRMPDVDGVQLLQEIRAIDSDICVIIMTAYPSVESAVDTMKADAFDYLRKPFELEQLRQVLQRAVREKGLMIDAEERVNQVLGAKIRQLRKDRALTLKQLANKTALSVSLISQIELGKSAASVSTLRKLATALGVSMSYLFEGV